MDGNKPNKLVLKARISSSKIIKLKHSRRDLKLSLFKKLAMEKDQQAVILMVGQRVGQKVGQKEGQKVGQKEGLKEGLKADLKAERAKKGDFSHFS